MNRISTLCAATGLAVVAGHAMAASNVTIATVNNNDMVTMQKLSSVFEKDNPDIKLNWVVLEENVLRQRLTTDIGTKGGQYDVLTIGLFEAPMWGAQNWLVPFDNAPASYDMADLIGSVKDGLSHDGKQYALPFYAESQMTFYRKDLFDKAGITMPDQPTWAQIGEYAAKINDPAHGVYGICLRGKPGWGENVGQIDPVANGYGARWFDMDWKAQFQTPAWTEALTTYSSLLQKYGPPGSASNGYNEILAQFITGKCGMWVDATVSASTLSDPKQSSVADKVAYAHAPYGKYNQGNHYLWAWALAVPVSSKQQEAAQKFVYWATSPAYIKLVADTMGVAAVPPGTRKSTYANEAYLKAAPFAKLTEDAIRTADMAHPTHDPVPYQGISFVGIPEFQAIGGQVGQEFAAVIAGKQTVDEGLAAAQRITERAMKQAGYPKKAMQ